jgi:hypothetical protein
MRGPRRSQRRRQNRSALRSASSGRSPPRTIVVYLRRGGLPRQRVSRRPGYEHTPARNLRSSISYQAIRSLLLNPRQNPQPLSISRPKLQLPPLPPKRTRIEPPSAPMPPRENIMDHPRHEERHGGKIVHAVLELPVRSSKNQGRDSLLLRAKQNIKESVSRGVYKRTDKKREEDGGEGRVQGGLTLSVAINSFSNARYASLNRALSYVSSARRLSISSWRCLTNGSANPSTSPLTFWPS